MFESTFTSNWKGDKTRGEMAGQTFLFRAEVRKKEGPMDLMLNSFRIQSVINLARYSLEEDQETLKRQFNAGSF